MSTHFGNTALNHFTTRKEERNARPGKRKSGCRIGQDN